MVTKPLSQYFNGDGLSGRLYRMEMNHNEVLVKNAV